MSRRARGNRKKNKNKKMNNKIISGIVATAVLIVLAFFGVNTEIQSSENNQENIEEVHEDNTNEDIQDVEYSKLEVYFIDVGQADSILIVNGNKTMLIDAGNNEDGDDVVNFIKNKGIEKLNYVIGTHPHEDHIGGLDDVINSFDVENIYMPKIETTTKTFEEVLDAIANKNLSITEPYKGQKITLGEANCEIMTDPILNEDNLNLSSIVINLQFGNNKFLFMGDSEEENEKTRQWSKVDVLKVGHHGSSTSSSLDFLEQVKPKYAIIMVGKNNSYGLPKSNVIKRLENVGAEIYRTDIVGTIQINSDGNNLEIISNDNAENAN